MDASRKPRMSREMMMRLSDPRRGSIDGFTAYGHTGRSINRKHRANSDRQYLNNYQSSAMASCHGHVRRFGMELGVVASGHDHKTKQSAEQSLSNRKPHTAKTETDRPNRQSSNANARPMGLNRPRSSFHEPPSRRYNPYA